MCTSLPGGCLTKCYQFQCFRARRMFRVCWWQSGPHKCLNFGRRAIINVWISPLIKALQYNASVLNCCLDLQLCWSNKCVLRALLEGSCLPHSWSKLTSVTCAALTIIEADKYRKLVSSTLTLNRMSHTHKFPTLLFSNLRVGVKERCSPPAWGCVHTFIQPHVAVNQ